MFDIRIICDPADEPDITRALTAAFDCDPIQRRPAHNGHHVRLYTKAFHPDPAALLNDAPETTAAGPTAWPTPEDAYATAPGITYEIAWTASTARTATENPHGGDVDREYWLRKAALLDRIALEYEAEGVHNDTDEIAANAAHQLIEIDQDNEGDYSGAPYGPEHPATLVHPRGYVRQEYARWAQNQ
ncbi:hypothetical protein [Streptomyces sp. S1D4-23]|uniref:hypothetical protein n=1 Tax=Streptomyces sp. S1D4-23 TaxID=2594463 RepID=UPI0011659BC3|nr:hypothetical protein [Streptomyces sp. S1D4-23]QDO09142.1 hypothetical protein FNV68_25430 [Streptomyces sp. S1D4-23]